MSADVEVFAERFDRALFLMMRNLGPSFISRTRLGLTPRQVFMLHYIQEENQCNVSQLAEKLEVAPSAITVMLDRLESHNFVIREPDENDRRVVMAHITEKGNQTLFEVQQVRRKILKHCLAQFDVDELSIFVKTLEKLARTAASMDIESVIGTEYGLER